MLGMAQVLYRQDRTQQARVLLERLHAESPDNAEVNALLERLKQPADAPR